MDFLQVCYRSKMRLYPDRPEVLTTGRWRWCPEGAEALPFPHAFGSMLFDPVGFELGAAQVGEVEWLGKVRGDANPRYRGRHHCGAAELYQQGSPFALRGTLPVDPDGVPLCCDAAPALGGLGLGGTGDASDWSSVGLWLRNVDLPDAPHEGDELSMWPAAPLTTRPAFRNSSPATLTTDSAFPAVDVLGAHAGPPLGVGSLALGIGDPFIAAADFTVFAVVRGVGALPSVYLAPTVTGAGRPILYADTSGCGVQGGGVVFSPAPLATDFISVYCWRRRGTSTEIWRNRTLKARATAGAPALRLELWQSQLSAPTATGFRAFELLAFSRALSDGELGAEWDYFQPFMGDDVLPPGMLADFATSTARDGWLLCDGSEHLESDFPALSAELAGAYDTHRGAAPPAAGSFRVPDFRGLVLAGGGGASVDPVTSAYATGETGGEEGHTVDVTEIPSHSHTVTDPGHVHTPAQPGFQFVSQGATGGILITTGAGAFKVRQDGATQNKVTGITLGNTGGGAALSLIQPTGVGWRFIKT